jgi:type I restriction enzyme M protein
VNALLKHATADEDSETVEVAQQLKDLLATEAGAKKEAKEAQAALDVVTLKKYTDLSEDDVKQLVLDDKWHATVATRIAGEVNSLTSHLVGRIQQLGERYAATVEDLDAELARLDGTVAGYLAAMGFK